MGLGTVQGADWGILNKYYENAIANICEELVVCNCDFRPHLELFLLIGLSNVLIRMSQRLMEERLSQRAPLQHSTPFNSHLLFTDISNSSEKANIKYF